MSKAISELKSGIIITSITKYLNIVLQIGLGGVLSRLLTPKEYGTVALVTVFTTFFSLISEVGLGVAIIQKKEISNEEKSDLLKVTIIIGMIMGVLFYNSSNLVASYYKEDHYIIIVKMFSILVFLNTILIVPQNLLRREKKFKILGTINILSAVLSGGIAIYLAFKGWSYFSIIIQSIANSLFQNIFSFFKVKIKISFRFKTKILYEIWSYSLYQFLFNFINYFSRNLDNLLVGKYMGSIALGYYDKAYKLMLYPLGILTTTVSSTLHPVLAKHQNDKEMIYQTYKKIVKIFSIIGFSLSVYLYFSSYEIINILYGENWNIAVPIFKILSLSICIQLILSTSGAIFQILGKTNYLFYSGLLSAIVMITSIGLGIYYSDLEKLAYFLCIAFSINFVQAYYLLIKRLFQKSYFKFLLELKSGIIIGSVSLCFYLVFIKHINFNLYINFLLKILLSTVAFLVGLKITGEDKEALKLLKR